MKQLMQDRMKWVFTLGVVMLALVALTGCKTSNPNTVERWPVPGQTAGGNTNHLVGQSSRLRVGDLITISFSDVPPPGLQEIKARIPDDGFLTLHYNVKVKAGDKTIPELEQEIREAFVPRLYKNLTAIVRAEERAFYVGGEVRSPGRWPLLGEMTVLRAIETAGSFTDFAQKKEIELRRENGERFTINWQKARKNSSLDIPVLANDHIYVPRRIF